MRLIHLEPRPVHFPSPTHHHRSSSNNIQQHPTTSNNIQQHPTTGPCSPSRRRCDGDRPRPFRVPFLFCVPFFFFEFCRFFWSQSGWFFVFTHFSKRSPIVVFFSVQTLSTRGRSIRRRRRRRRWPMATATTGRRRNRRAKQQTNKHKQNRFFFCFRFASVPQQPRPSNRRRQEKKEQGKPNNGVEGSKGRPNDRR